MMSRLFRSPAAVMLLLTGVLLLFSSGCMKQAREGEKAMSLRFAVTGNSFPDSPFTYSFELFDQVIKAVNEDNPLLFFHTGNMVHGGMAWMGINKRDMDGQFRDLKKSLGQLRAIFYPVIGPKDLYNGSRELFARFSGKPESYIVQYGNLAFIVFDRQHNTGEPTATELAALKEKLEACRDGAAIFLFTHAPWFKVPPRWSRGKDADIPEGLHGLLKAYRVKGVFSGTPFRFYQQTQDGILYSVTGCGGFRIDERYRNTNQYYLVDFDGKECTIAAKQVKLEYNKR